MRRFSSLVSRWLLAGLMGGAAAMATTGTWAQTYPNKPIRIIVPAGSGDSCDILARLVAPKLTERLGQPVVIDNRAGSAGQLGLTLIKQAAPDGYTLYFQDMTTHAINAAADDAIVGASHADVALESGTTGKDALVGSWHMCVRAEHSRDAASPARAGMPLFQIDRAPFGKSVGPNSDSAPVPAT